MKKILLLFFGILLTGVIAAQNQNWYRNLMKFHGGVKIGNTVVSTGANKPGSLLLTTDSVTTDNVAAPTLYKVYRGGTQLTPDIPASGGIDISTFFSKTSPDTVQHTANYTVTASDWTKDQHCNKATSIIITLPPSLTEWPIGGVMNFYGHGAGIMVFKKGSGVVFISDKDSIATSRKGQAVTVKKLAASKYFLVGPLTD